MPHEEIDILWHKAMHDSVQNDEMFTRYRFATLVAQAEREVCCAIVTGLCLSDNNAHEINTEIRVRGEKEGGGDASKETTALCVGITAPVVGVWTALISHAYAG